MAINELLRPIHLVSSIRQSRSPMPGLSASVPGVRHDRQPAVPGGVLCGGVSRHAASGDPRPVMLLHPAFYYQ